MRPLISVIIVNWKVRRLLEACLRSILAETADLSCEIFVVDNDSRDGTPEMILADYPQVTMISLASNRGFAAANNLALKQIRGEFIFLLNPDTKVLPGFFAAIIDYFRLNAEVKIIGPKILNADLTVQPSVRRWPTLASQILVLLKLINLWPGLPILRRYLARDFDYNKEGKAEQIMGAAMIFRREVLTQVGYFDQNFFTWYEEVDWCRRAKKKNLDIYYLPAAEIIHYGGASFSQQPKFARQLIFDWSLLYYFFKHHNILSALVILLFIPLNIILTFAYLLWIHPVQETEIF